MESELEILYDRSEPSTIIQLCYCCQETPSSVLLWQQQGDNETYGQMLQNCFGLEFQVINSENDVICSICLNKLQESVMFKQQVISAQEKQQMYIFLDDNVVDLEFSEVTGFEGNGEIEIEEHKVGYFEPIPSIEGVDDNVAIEEATPPKQPNIQEVNIKQEKEERSEIDSNRKRTNNKISEPQKTKFVVNPDDFMKLENKKYQCRKCDTTLNDYVSTLKHINNFHYKNTSYKCVECDVYFVSQLKLDKHRLECHSEASQVSSPHKKKGSKKQPLEMRVLLERIKVDTGTVKVTTLTRKGATANEEISTRYACEKCSHTFEKRELYLQHVQSHRIEDQSQGLPQNAAKQTIITTIKLPSLKPEDYTKLDKNKFKCNHCGKILTMRRLIEHVNRQHRGNYTNLCEICNEKFSTENQLNKHKAEVHKIDTYRYTCKDCDKVCFTQKLLIVHRNTVHGQKKKCPRCDCEIPKETYNEHILTHKLERYPCPHCDKLFKSKKYRNKHIRDHELNKIRDVTIKKTRIRKKKVFRCGQCSETFEKSTLFYQHNRRHFLEQDSVEVVESPVTVIETPKKQPNLAAEPPLNPEDYTKTDDNKFKCNHCNKTIREFYRFRRHVNTQHHRHYRFICEVCNEKFLTEVLLNKHKTEIHNLDTKYPCNACEKVFWSDKTLRDHIKGYHRQGKTRKCPYCDFTTYFSLTDHLRKHIRERKYSCPFCPKVFHRPDSHRLHVRIHTGDKRKVCHICGERFVQRNSLNCHIMKFHPNEMVPSKGLGKRPIETTEESQELQELELDNAVESIKSTFSV